MKPLFSLQDTPLLTTSVDQQDPLVRRLTQIADRSPHLVPIARLYAAIFPLLRDTEPVMASIDLSTDDVREKLDRGQYLLQGLDVELNAPAVTELLIRLAEAAGAAGANVDAGRLRQWLHRRGDNAAGLLQSVLEVRDALLPDAAVLGMDAGLFRALAQNALKPDLRTFRSRLAPLAAGSSWNRGTCFVCGALPVFGELQGNVQALHLRCGVCGADWEYHRLGCASCGNDDHRERDSLFPEGTERQEHVEACKRCNTYIKVIAAFSPTPVDLLPVEDLATVHLDAAARERGYWRAPHTH